MTIILDNGRHFSINKIEHFKRGENEDEGFREEHIRVWFQPCSVTSVADRGWYYAKPCTPLAHVLLCSEKSIIEKEEFFAPYLETCLRSISERGFFKYTGKNKRNNADLIPWYKNKGE